MHVRSTHPLALALLTCALGWSAGVSAAPAAKTQPGAEVQARYQQDLQLCAAETDAASRMQCKRDAKAEYDKALAEAKAGHATSAKPASPAVPVCADCGKVSAVTQIDKEGESGAVGLLAGGAAGALLGHQVGGGLGKELATLAGAAGGAYAGKQIEQKVRTHKVWSVSVRYPGGESANYEFAQDPGLQVGDSVRRSDNTIVRP